MTQENKELLLKDLSARLPYGVIMTNKVLTETYYPLDGNEWQQAYYDNDWNDVPYLRPMSSMTEEEQKEFVEFHRVTLCPIIMDTCLTIENEGNMFDWLNIHHFDYRSLIEKGLAIEAPKGMYNKKGE